VIGSLAVDGWAVSLFTFGTARRARPQQAASHSPVLLFKHFTVHIEHGRKTAIANECELIARSETCQLRPAKS